MLNSSITVPLTEPVDFWFFYGVFAHGLDDSQKVFWKIQMRQQSKSWLFFPLPEQWMEQ